MSHQYDLRKRLFNHSQTIDNGLKNILEIIKSGNNFISKTLLTEAGKNLQIIDINDHIAICDNIIDIMNELKKILNLEERRKNQQKLENKKKIAAIRIKTKGKKLKRLQYEPKNSLSKLSQTSICSLTLKDPQNSTSSITEQYLES